jgi:hypothetical protein
MLCLAWFGASSACGRASMSRWERCEYVGTQERTGPSSSPHLASPADSPDFERLRAYRHYFSLSRVESFAHHFAVYFACVEPSVHYYDVTEQGRVLSAGSGWGSEGIHLHSLPPIPAELAAQVALVRARFEADYRSERRVEIMYLGSYRKLVVQEIVPLPRDDAGKPLAARATATFAAARDLQTMDGPFTEYLSGMTLLCNPTFRDCVAPWWIDFAAQSQLGYPLLPTFTTRHARGSGVRRAAFQETLLAAARRWEKGEPGVPVERLLARQEDSPLPHGFAPPLSATFTLHARARENSGVGQEDAELSLELSAREAVFGEAHARGSVSVGGMVLSAEVSLAAVQPVPRDHSGRVDVPMRLRYELRDERGNLRQADVPVLSTFLVEREAVVASRLQIDPEVMGGPHEPPGSQSLPGSGPYSSLDVYLELAGRPRRWE